MLGAVAVIVAMAAFGPLRRVAVAVGVGLGPRPTTRLTRLATSSRRTGEAAGMTNDSLEGS